MAAPIGCKHYFFEGENGSFARIDYLPPYGEWALYIDGGFNSFERDGKRVFADLPDNIRRPTYEECHDYLMGNGNVRFELVYAR